MRTLHPLRAALLGAVLCAACGESGQTARCTPSAPASPPHTTAGPLTAFTDRAVVPSGASLQASVRVTGPAHYQAPCSGPLQVIVVDSTDIHVDSLSAVAPRGTPCGTVSLAAGQTAEYDVLWDSDPTLPPGDYRLVLGLGDQPQLVLHVRLGLDIGCLSTR